MVLKRSKCGLNSGNSYGRRYFNYLKRTNTLGFPGQYFLKGARAGYESRKFFAVKFGSRTTHVIAFDAENDDLAAQNSLTYSLNKKKRWELLPDFASGPSLSRLLCKTPASFNLVEQLDIRSLVSDGVKSSSVTFAPLQSPSSQDSDETGLLCRQEDTGDLLFVVASSTSSTRAALTRQQVDNEAKTALIFDVVGSEAHALRGRCLSRGVKRRKRAEQLSLQNDIDELLCVCSCWIDWLWRDDGDEQTDWYEDYQYSLALVEDQRNDADTDAEEATRDRVSTTETIWDDEDDWPWIIDQYRWPAARKFDLIDFVVRKPRNRHASRRSSRQRLSSSSTNSESDFVFVSPTDCI